VRRHRPHQRQFFPPFREQGRAGIRRGRTVRKQRGGGVLEGALPRAHACARSAHRLCGFSPGCHEGGPGCVHVPARHDGRRKPSRRIRSSAKRAAGISNRTPPLSSPTSRQQRPNTQPMPPGPHTVLRSSCRLWCKARSSWPSPNRTRRSPRPALTIFVAISSWRSTLRQQRRQQPGNAHESSGPKLKPRRP